MAKIAVGIGMIAATLIAVASVPFLGPVGVELAIATISAGASMTLSGIADALRSVPGTSISVRSSAGVRQVVYGQMRVSGSEIYRSTSTDYADLHKVIAWASHQCKSIDVLYIDGRELYLNADGSCTTGSYYDAAGNKYTFANNDGHNRAWAYNALGTAAGHWFQELFNRDNRWTSDCTLNGICATHFVHRFNSDIYSGDPSCKAAIHGKCDIYDPRLGARLLSDGVTPNPATHIWTDNAALCIADVLTNSDFGLGCTWAEIDIDQLIAAANICDEAVPLALGGATIPNWQANFLYALNTTVIDSNGNMETVIGFTTQYLQNAVSGSGAPNWVTVVGNQTIDGQIVWQNNGRYSTLSEKRYTVNGVADYNMSPGDMIDGMLLACEGRISYSGGMFKIFPAAWYGTNLSFGASDLVGPVKWTPKRKARELCNAVRAVYTCPVYPYAIVGYDRNHKDGNIFSGEYQATDAPEYACDSEHGYAVDPFLTADGVKLYNDRRYQFVTSVAQVQRLMKIYLLRNRQQGSGTLQMQLSAFQTQAQDVIQFNFAALGFSNKWLEVQNFRFVPKMDPQSPNQAPSLMCELDVNETDPSVFLWSTAEERGVENTASPTLYDDRQVKPPTNLVLESGSDSAVTGVDGLVQPRIHATWTEPQDTFVTEGGSIIVQLQKVGDSTWKTVAQLGGQETECYIPGVVCGQQYNVQIFSQRASGATSAVVEVGPHTVSVTTSSFTSTVLNNQGSVLPSVGAIIGYTCTNNSITFTWAAQTMPRPDGSSISIPAGTLTYSGLQASTPYYTYWYVRVSDGTLQVTNGNPPPTSPNQTMAFNTALDGRVPLPVITVTTLAASNGGTGGGTGGGGGDVCPESSEVVDIKLPAKAGEVRIGDPILGYSFKKGCDVYRHVTHIATEQCVAWRIVDGHRVSPCEPVYHEDAWKPAFRATGAKLDTFSGVKVRISVEADEYDEMNYWLLSPDGGNRLLIHNTRISPC